MESNNYVMCFKCQNTFSKESCKPLEIDGLNRHDVVFCPKCLKEFNYDIFLAKLIKDGDLFDRLRTCIYYYLRGL